MVVVEVNFLPFSAQPLPPPSPRIAAFESNRHKLRQLGALASGVGSGPLLNIVNTLGSSMKANQNPSSIIRCEIVLKSRRRQQLVTFAKESQQTGAGKHNSSYTE